MTTTPPSGCSSAMRSVSPAMAKGWPSRRVKGKTDSSTDSLTDFGTQLTAPAALEQAGEAVGEACVTNVSVSTPANPAAASVMVVTQPGRNDADWPAEAGRSASRQSLRISWLPSRQVSAPTNTGAALRVPESRAAMQYGKHAPTAAEEHRAGAYAHLGTSQRVASTDSQVPRVMQSSCGMSVCPAPNGAVAPSRRCAGHRTDRTESSTPAHVMRRAQVSSWNQTVKLASVALRAALWERNEHRTRRPWSVSRHRHPSIEVVCWLPGRRDWVRLETSASLTSAYRTAATPSEGSMRSGQSRAAAEAEVEPKK